MRRWLRHLDWSALKRVEWDYYGFIVICALVMVVVVLAAITDIARRDS